MFNVDPGLDMMRVSFKRIIIGKNPLTGDENHLHHRIKNKLNSNYALIINFNNNNTYNYLQNL